MLKKTDFKDSTGIVRDWLLVKYQVLNNCHNGIYLSDYYGKPEILYEYRKPGCGLFFDDEKFERMKAAGYFVGSNGKHLGEGGAEVTNKCLDELKLEQEQIENKRKSLIEKGYKIFLESSVVEQESQNATEYYNREDYKSGMEWEATVNLRRNYLLSIYRLYLIPTEEIDNIKKGTRLVSSKDAKEVIFNGSLDWQINDGYSVYGIQLMPEYADESLF